MAMKLSCWATAPVAVVTGRGKRGACPTTRIAGFVLGLWLATAALGAAATAARPNIIVIMVDDMGFSDVSCYGGTIPTPNLDALAAGGMRFTDFYVNSVCAPTRASFMTGLYPHKAGVGTNIAKWNDPFWPRIPSPAYQSLRSEDTITIAELLRRGGYQTYMTGKWHLGDEPERWPNRRGFDRSFALVWGATDSNEHPQWAPYCLDGQRFTNFPADFYVTDAFTDYALRFIREGDPAQPFFLFQSYNAPHAPHGAPQENLDRMRGILDLDPERERERRFARQKILGLFPPGMELGQRDPVDPATGTHSPATLRTWYERYAAMIDRVDQQVGRLVAELKQMGRYENTLIVFLSDNGGTSAWYGNRWAETSNTPFRLMKGWVHEGGIHTPFIVHWPGHTPAGTFNRAQVGHVMDLLPTFAAVAGVEIPTTFEGRRLQPLDGINLLPAFLDPAHGGPRTLCWEHAGSGAIRDGRWKLVRAYAAPQDGNRTQTTGPRTGPWELYDLAEDRSENHDVAAQHPEKVAALTARYGDWERECRVVPWEDIVAELARFHAAEKDKQKPQP